MVPNPMRHIKIKMATAYRALVLRRPHCPSLQMGPREVIWLVRDSVVLACCKKIRKKDFVCLLVLLRERSSLVASHEPLSKKTRTGNLIVLDALQCAAPAATLLVVDVVLVVVAGVDGGVEVLLAAVRLVGVRRDGVAGVAGVAVREVVVAATVNMMHGVVRVRDGLARVRVVLVNLDRGLVRLHGDQDVRRDRLDLGGGAGRGGAGGLGGGGGHRRWGFLGVFC